MMNDLIIPTALHKQQLTDAEKFANIVKALVLQEDKLYEIVSVVNNLLDRVEKLEKPDDGVNDNS